MEASWRRLGGVRGGVSEAAGEVRKASWRVLGVVLTMGDGCGVLLGLNMAAFVYILPLSWAFLAISGRIWALKYGFFEDHFLVSIFDRF